MNHQEFFDRAYLFLDELNKELNLLSINMLGLNLDHLCYRVATETRYSEMKLFLTGVGDLLVESEVGGRPIATFKFNTPIIYKNLRIPLIELPAPKNNSKYSEGFEHVEAVISQSFAEFMRQHSQLQFDLSAANKKINPEIRIKLPNNISIKFHHQSLEDVITFEKMMGI